MLTRKDFLLRLGAGLPAAAIGLGGLPASVEETAEPPTHGAISVLDFGAAGDGVQDDTAAIQKALDSERNVFFPDGRYRVSRTLTVNAGGQTLFAHGRNHTFTVGRSGAIIPDKDLKGPVFHITASAVIFLGLIITGPGKESEVTALHFEKPYNADDVDGKVIGCTLQSFGTGVSIVGRGMSLESNSFAMVREVLRIDWPTEHLEGEGLQMLPYGMRAFFIFNNRVHTCSTFVVNEGEKAEHLWGLNLTGNLMDIGDALFRGSASYSSISGNVVCHTRRTPLYFNRLCHSTAITGNVISGGDASDGKQPAHGIWFDGDCRDVTVSGNAFAHIRDGALLFNAGRQEHVVINGNTFDHIGFDGAPDRGIIRIAKPADSFAITGNSFNSKADGAESIVHAKEQRLSGFQVVGNVFGPEKQLVTEYVDGGRNSFQGV